MFYKCIIDFEVSVQTIICFQIKKAVKALMSSAFVHHVFNLTPNTDAICFWILVALRV